MTAEELLSGKDGGGSKVGYRDTKGRDALMQSIRAKGETCAAAETKDGEARAPMENWDGKRDTALKDVTDMGFADDPRPVSKGAASGADADNAYSAPPVGGAGGDANNAYTAPPIQGDAGDTNNAYTAPPIQGDAGDAGNAYTAPPIQGDAGDAGNAYTAPPIQGDAGDAGNAYTAPPIQGDAGDAGNAYTAPPVSGDNGPVYSAPPLGNDDYDDDSSEYDEAPPEPNASDNAEYGAVPGHMRDAQDGAAQAPPEYDGYGAVPQVEEATGVDGNNEDADISAQETYGVVPGAKDRKEANRDQP